jgi:hypothetical protein
MRDEQVLGLYLAGHSYRAIAAQPGVRLSPAGVLKVVRRLLAAGVDAAVASAAFAAAYPAACEGDHLAISALRRFGRLLDCGGMVPRRGS